MKKITGNLSAVNDKSAQVAFLDFDKLHFPITIRKWKQGDVFYPLGMKGKMKLSDFFINTKISINDKEDIHVLESDNKIAWIIGHRIDNRFKVSLSTSRIYKVVRL
jgi:tRNA(Ile)-lysidine synthase